MGRKLYEGESNLRIVTGKGRLLLESLKSEPRMYVCMYVLSVFCLHVCDCSCGNVNWARRSDCNICHAPKFGTIEPRTGNKALADVCGHPGCLFGVGVCYYCCVVAVVLFAIVVVLLLLYYLHVMDVRGSGGLGAPLYIVLE